MSGIRVIVVEDNEDLRDELSFQLDAAGLRVRVAVHGRALDALLAQEPCDVLVLDINLPDEDGFSIARRLCDPQQLSIIMLTARYGVEDKARGLEEGADSYLVKPIDRRELVACIKALYRRLALPERAPQQWALDVAARQLVSPDGRRLGLTGKDVVTLSMLAQVPGRIRHREELVTVLGIDFLESPEGRTNTIVSRLRQKLVQFDAELRIVSWRNEGYSYAGPPIRLMASGLEAAVGAQAQSPLPGVLMPGPRAI